MQHHVLNDYCLKQFVFNDFRAINDFCFYGWNNNGFDFIV